MVALKWCSSQLDLEIQTKYVLSFYSWSDSSLWVLPLIGRENVLRLSLFEGVVWRRLTVLSDCCSALGENVGMLKVICLPSLLLWVSSGWHAVPGKNKRLIPTRVLILLSSPPASWLICSCFLPGWWPSVGHRFSSPQPGSLGPTPSCHCWWIPVWDLPGTLCCSGHCDLLCVLDMKTPIPNAMTPLPDTPAHV